MLTTSGGLEGVEIGPGSLPVWSQVQNVWSLVVV